MDLLVRLAKPATVLKIGDSYIVTGVAWGNAPHTKPSRHMRIEREGSEWTLFINEVRYCSKKTLKAARYAASEIEAGIYGLGL